MYIRHIFLCLFNFSCTILILKSLSYILPSYITSYYFQAADLLLCVVISKFTFGYSRKLLFRERVQSKGKAVLITGCARGIGKLLAKRLDSKGFHVFASCRNPDSPSVDDLRKNCSNRLKVLQLDVTKDESVDKAVQFVKENLGTSELWAVVNNAGISEGCITELTSVQDFKNTIEVNAIGQVRVTKAFLPLLRKSRGRVINMASLAGRKILPMCGPYSMSKFASVAFSENLRIELNDWGVCVISLEPDAFETDMVKGENVELQVETTLATAKEEVREDYGEDYLKKLKCLMGKALPPSPKVQKLIDDIECAVSLKTPDFVYRTYRHMFSKIIFSSYIASSPEWQVLLCNMYKSIWGLPKPKKANKI